MHMLKQQKDTIQTSQIQSYMDIQLIQDPIIILELYATEQWCTEKRIYQVAICEQQTEEVGGPIYCSLSRTPASLQDQHKDYLYHQVMR